MKEVGSQPTEKDWRGEKCFTEVENFHLYKSLRYANDCKGESIYLLAVFTFVGRAALGDIA